MTRTVTIEPVTRVEGHAKITLLLDDGGQVADARFHVTELRGFEKFCLGRSYREMPAITARICGICPVSHSLAAAKAGDAIKGVRIPPAAEKLRRLLTWAQLVQSHALSFFHLSGPDLLLGMESDPKNRSLFGLIATHPDVARDGIRLRAFGQEVIRLLGDRSVHPAWAVAGGGREPLTAEQRDHVKARLPEALAIARKGLALGYEVLARHADTAAHCGNFPSLFLGLTGEDGTLEHYDGTLRMIDAQGRRLEDGVDPLRYQELLGEAEEPWSYMKFPYYRPLGYADGGGMYRVGPLARLNVADKAGTPEAEAELQRFRALTDGGGPVLGSFYSHQARLIEILYALERIAAILTDPELTSEHVRSHASTNHSSGIGVVEAPRGTLFHEYHVDEHGLLTRVNLLVATGQNNLAMNRTILQIARAVVCGGRLDEGALNRIEHGIRAFDPCLSCATHALGKMPFEIVLLGPDGTLLQRVAR
ncbi:MAG: Ni/Fe hydrogenase subunit alpha [Desulfuromonas sp.]|nr:Ni/Fe hydrogenase subunit alpha [Desulfuromonas sp.]